MTKTQVNLLFTLRNEETHLVMVMSIDAITYYFVPSTIFFLKQIKDNWQASF